MSRYQINKFISYVEGSDDEVRLYVADPATYVDRWQARASALRLPTANSGTLTAEERSAFLAKDYAALYRLGAHPYVLWHFAESVWVWAGELSWAELNRRYGTAASEVGYPDFST